MTTIYNLCTVHGPVVARNSLSLFMTCFSLEQSIDEARKHHAAPSGLWGYPIAIISVSGRKSRLETIVEPA